MHKKIKCIKKQIIGLPDRFPIDYSIQWKGKDNDPESGITCSMIYTYLRCRTAFLFALHCWKAIGKGPGIIYGSMFHHFLEKFYGKGKIFSDKEVTYILRRYIADTPEDFDQLSKDEVYRLLAVAEVMAKWYMRYYKDDLRKYKFDALEGEFDCEWQGWRLRGKRDGLVRLKKEPKRLLLWENKNYWQISSSITELLQFDLQNQFYVLSNQAETGEDIAGVKYNICRVPQNKMKGSIKEYKTMLDKLIQKNPSYYFIRYDVVYTSGEKKRFAGELEKILREIRAVLQGLHPVYKNYGACEGKYKCKFIHACSTNSLKTYEQIKTRFPELEGVKK